MEINGLFKILWGRTSIEISVKDCRGKGWGILYRRTNDKSLLQYKSMQRYIFLTSFNFMVNYTVDSEILLFLGLVDCVWSPWRSADCSKSCGGGYQLKSRSKTVEEKHGGSCIGESAITASCNSNPCKGTIFQHQRYLARGKNFIF